MNETIIIKEQVLSRQQFLMLLVNTPEQYIYKNDDGMGEAWFYSEKFVNPFQKRDENGLIRKLEPSEIALKGSYYVVNDESN